jgi:hypothetical protein
MKVFYTLLLVLTLFVVSSYAATSQYTLLSKFHRYVAENWESNDYVKYSQDWKDRFFEHDMRYMWNHIHKIGELQKGYKYASLRSTSDAMYPHMIHTKLLLIERIQKLASDYVGYHALELPI